MAEFAYVVYIEPLCWVCSEADIIRDHPTDNEGRTATTWRNQVLQIIPMKHPQVMGVYAYSPRIGYPCTDLVTYPLKRNVYTADDLLLGTVSLEASTFRGF